MRDLLLFLSLSALIMASGCASFGSSASGERLKRMQASENYNKKEGIFENEIPTEIVTKNRFSLFFQFFFGGEDNRQPPRPPAIVKLSPHDFDTSPGKGSFRITWLGHSTIMIEIDGRRVLIDPVFSKRSSPYSWVGPGRFHQAPISVKELPFIDAVVISHDHFDHLDYDSIKELDAKTGVFLVPLGVGAHIESWGVKSQKVQEFDWWQKTKVGTVEFVCTPARHFSGRGLFDESETLWASWVIKGESQRIFYSGDTGPMPAFDKIGEEHGPFDLTMMQLGAYGKFWPYIHMTPDEAMVAHKQVKGKLFLPVHWGTFDLGLHSWNGPLNLTKKAAAKHGVPTLYPRPGQQFVISGDKVSPARYNEFALEKEKN